MKRNYFRDEISSQALLELLENVPEEILKEITNFKELMMMYHSAIREVNTKLEILNDELSLGYRENPIQVIKSRVKKPKSILKKLQKMEKGISIESIINSLDDVAGIRVICAFIDDIYKVKEMLLRQDDIVLIKEKDYIKNPKPNGYRSYHLIIEVPVFFSDQKQWVRVEIQIRTVAMDFWASLEHQLKYKKDLKTTQEIEIELKKTAEIIAETDSQMMYLRKKLEKSH